MIPNLSRIYLPLQLYRVIKPGWYRFEVSGVKLTILIKSIHYGHLIFVKEAKNAYWTKGLNL